MTSFSTDRVFHFRPSELQLLHLFSLQRVTSHVSRSIVLRLLSNQKSVESRRRSFDCLFDADGAHYSLDHSHRWSHWISSASDHPRSNDQ